MDSGKEISGGRRGNKLLAYVVSFLHVSYELDGIGSAHRYIFCHNSEEKKVGSFFLPSFLLILLDKNQSAQ